MLVWLFVGLLAYYTIKHLKELKNTQLKFIGHIDIAMNEISLQYQLKDSQVSANICI